MTHEREICEGAATHSPAIEKCARLGDRIVACIDAAVALDPSRSSLCEELREKIRTNTFNLVVVGQFKRGKTMLINALLGADILPVAVVPLTSIVTIIAYGGDLVIDVVFNDGRTSEIEPRSLADYVTEKGNPKNIKDIKEVLVTYPSPYLKDGVRLIDTPGVGSVYRHNTDVAYQYLPKSDAALFLLSVEQPVSQAELDFLKDVRQHAHKIFFLLNKIDYFSQEEVQESIRFSKEVIEGVMESPVKIFPISAKLALEGKLSDTQELSLKSCLPDFSQTLDQFLMHEKGKVLLLSATGSLLKILSQARLESVLELKSLTTPIEELEAKIEMFQREKKEILLEKQHLGALLDSDLDGLIKSVLDEDLAGFKSELTEEMGRRFDAFSTESRSLTLKELDEALEAFVVSEVKRAFVAWRAAEDEKISAAFEEMCGRLRVKMDERVEELLRFSSQLFAVPYEPGQAVSFWTVKEDFYYKFKEEPVGLDMLSSSITRTLPGLVSDRFHKLRTYLFKMANRRILRKRREHMVQIIDMQAGRIRHDFVDRLSKSKQGFRRETIEKIEATVDGITAAIENGRSRRYRGEKEIEHRLSSLSQGLLKLDELRDELGQIKESVQGM